LGSRFFFGQSAERTTAKAGTKCVSTNFPKAEKSAPGEEFLWGHQADRKPAVKLSPMKPQLRGAFALQAKNLAYDRRRFDRTTAWAFIKK
jgi:hypothetical protein